MPKQKEICLLPVPFSDLTSNKRRPVLIVSNNFYNDTNEDILVMAITSNIQESELNIYIKNDDMNSGSLKADSNIRVDKIYSIRKTLIIKTFGELKDEKFEGAINKLWKLLK